MTDAELDQVICHVTELAAFTVAMGTAIREDRQRERWVRADWIEARYAVTTRWCYHHQHELMAESRGRRWWVALAAVK